MVFQLRDDRSIIDGACCWNQIYLKEIEHHEHFVRNDNRKVNLHFTGSYVDVRAGIRRRITRVEELTRYCEIRRLHARLCTRLSIHGVSDKLPRKARSIKLSSSLNENAFLLIVLANYRRPAILHAGGD